MSKGNFNYEQEKLANLIGHAKTLERNEKLLNKFEDRERIASILKHYRKCLDLAYITLERLDYVLAGEDDEENFNINLRSNLVSLDKKYEI